MAKKNCVKKQCTQYGEEIYIRTKNIQATEELALNESILCRSCNYLNRESKSCTCENVFKEYFIGDKIEGWSDDYGTIEKIVDDRVIVVFDKHGIKDYAFVSLCNFTNISEKAREIEYEIDMRIKKGELSRTNIADKNNTNTSTSIKKEKDNEIDIRKKMEYLKAIIL